MGTKERWAASGDTVHPEAILRGWSQTRELNRSVIYLWRWRNGRPSGQNLVLNIPARNCQRQITVITWCTLWQFLRRLPDDANGRRPHGRYFEFNWSTCRDNRG